ncbi:MAG TPA: hypothetical protein DCQ31_18065 [Bacteroidales bacterium]|nr:hypothetical protein [Bacteroidales bacterium]
MENTHHDLFERIKEMFMKYSIKSVTMDDISRELGISKKTLYQCVVDKEDLVDKIFAAELVRVEAIIMSIKQTDLNAIAKFIESNKLMHEIMDNYDPGVYYDLRKYYPNVYSKLVNVRRKHTYEAMFNNLEQGKNEGLYRAEINSEIIAKMHVLKIEAMIENDFVAGIDLPKAQVFNEIFTYHILGVCNEAGIIEFNKLTNNLTIENQ